MAFDPTTAQDLNLPPDVLSTLAPAEPQEQTTVSTIPPKAAFDPGSAQEIDVPPDVLFHQSSGKTVQVPPGLSGAEADFVVKKHALGEQPSRFWGIVDLGTDALATLGGYEDAAVRGGANLFATAIPKMVGGNLQEFGERSQASAAKGVPNLFLPNIYQTDGTVAGGQTYAAIADAGKALSAHVDTWAQTHGLGQLPEGDTTGRNFAFDLGSGVASTGVAIAMTYLTRSPTAAAGLFGNMQKSQIYQEARAKGFTPEEAGRQSTTQGMVNGTLEALGDGLFKRMAEMSKPIGRIVMRSVEEATQEGLQQASEEGLAATNDLRDTNMLEKLKNVGYSFLIGGLSGAPVATVTELAEQHGVPVEAAQKVVDGITQQQPQVHAAAADLLGMGTNGLAADPKAEAEAAKVVKQFQNGEPIDVPAGAPDLTPAPQGGNLEKMLTQRLTEKGLPADQVQSNATLVRSAYETMLQRYPELRADINKEFAGLEVGDGQTLEQGALAQSSIHHFPDTLGFHNNVRIGDTSLSYHKEADGIGLSMIQTKDTQQGQGSARQALQQFNAWADEQQIPVYLTPVKTDRSMDKDRLTQFYKDNGFIRNPSYRKGDGQTDRTLAERYNMVRYPSAQRDVLYQGGPQNARGAITFRPGSSIIKLFEGKDASTFLHETGHFYWETMDKLSQKTNAPQRLKDDAQTIRAWVGAKPGAEITVDQHEQIARGVEAYLLQGKAPSAKLAPVFERFRQWLRDIYKSAKALKVTITPEVQGVMDRIFATDEEMQQVRQSAVAEEALGRVRFLDRQIAALDDQMDALDKLMQERGDKPNVANQNRMDRLQAQRDVLDEERAQILTNEDTQHAFESATTKAGKTIEMQAGRLKRLAEQALEAKRRALEEGLRAGRALARTDVAAAQKLVVDTIQASGLDAKDKAKFLDTLKTLQTSAQLEKLLPKIQSRIGTLLERQAQRVAKDQLLKLLKKTQTRKQGGKAVGKFDADMQKTLDNLRGLTKLKAADAQAELDRRADKYGYSGTDSAQIRQSLPTAEEALENRILAVMADNTLVPSTDTEDLVDEVRSLYTEGRLRGLDRELARREHMADLRQSLLDALGKDGKDMRLRDNTTLGARAKARLREIRGDLFAYLENWANTIDTITHGDEALSEELGNEVSDKLQQAKQITQDAFAKFQDDGMQALGITKVKQFWKKMAEDSKPFVVGDFVDANGEAIKWQMSRAQMRKLWMEMQDPSLHDRLTNTNGNAYTQEMLDTVDQMLTQEDKAFAMSQLEFYRWFYPQINKVYAETYGTDLASNPMYSPVRAEHMDAAKSTFQEEQAYRRSATNGSLKQRTAKSALKPQNDYTALQQHIAQMAHFIAMNKKVQDLSSLFATPEIRKEIEARHSNAMMQNIDGYIQDFALGRPQRLRAGAQIISKLYSNFASSILGGKLAMIPKQASSFLAYSEQVPVKHFIAGMADFWAHPKEAARILNDSALVKARGSDLERTIALAQKSHEFGTFRNLDNLNHFLRMPEVLGDKSSLLLGGWPVYYYHTKVLGKSHEEGIKAFERATATTQQSGDIDQQSRFQMAGGIGARILTMFQSGQNQFYRREVKAMRDYKNGSITMGQMAKTVFLYHVVLPELYQFIANGFDWDTDDELRAMILGSFNGIFVLNDAMDSLLRKAFGDKVFGGREMSPFGFMGDIVDGISKLSADDADLSEVIDGWHLVLNGIGAVTGTPLGRLADLGKAGEDLSEGDPRAAILRTAGFPNSIANKAAAQAEEGY